LIKRIIIVIALIIAVMLGRGLFYYSGFYHATAVEKPSYEHIVVPPAPSAEFSDNVSERNERTVLIDLAHDNSFDIGELNVLMWRLASRGLTIKFLGVQDDLTKELLGEEKVPSEKKEGNEEKFQAPQAFIIACPWKEFSKEERKSIHEFVEKGGKLLLIADPTRQSRINNLSPEFGVIFEPDYLYNMKENEINYRNIFIAEFKQNEITKNVRKIALYTAGSISSADDGIAFVDQNTFSSVIESRRRLSPIVLAYKGKVLAVHDITFMSEPYNGVLDNNQLISNIANWLASLWWEKVGAASQ